MKVPTYMVKVVPVFVRERYTFTPLRPGAPSDRGGRKTTYDASLWGWSVINNNAAGGLQGLN